MWGAMSYRCNKKAINALIAAGVIVGTLSGCHNMYRDFSDKSSDSYLIFQAKSYMDALDFDSAITSITPVVASQPTNEEVAYIASASYAGRAGLRILDLFSKLASELSSKSILQIFAEHFPGATDTTVADIESATRVLEAFSPRASGRSPSLNFYALFLYYSRIGVILNRYAYDSTSTLRTNFTACNTQDTPDAAETGIPNDMIDRIMTSIPRVLDAASGATGGGSTTNALSSASLPPELSSFSPIPCSTDSNDVRCLAGRTFVNIGRPTGIGLGTGSGGGICLVTTP